MWWKKSHLDVEEMTTVSFEEPHAKELCSVVPEVKVEEWCFVVFQLATGHWVESCCVEGNAEGALSPWYGSPLSPLSGLVFLAASLWSSNLGHFGRSPCLSPIPKPLQILS